MTDKRAGLKYGVWYVSTDPKGAWRKIKVEWVDDNPPTTYGMPSSRGRKRVPEDPGFCAQMIDSYTSGPVFYSPPMVDPKSWRPGEVPRRTGEDYLKWLEARIADGSLVEEQRG